MKKMIEIKDKLRKTPCMPLKKMRFKALAFLLAASTPLMATHSDPTNGGSHQTNPNSRRTSIPSNVNPPVGPFVRTGTQVFFEAEFLYWYANLSNSSPYIKRVVTSRGNIANTPLGVPVKEKDLDWEWDPGARVAFGLIFERDGWDLLSQWTYFHNNASRSKTVPTPTMISGNAGATIGSTTLISPWSTNPGLIFSFVDGKYSLNFNQVDLTSGKRYWISHFFSWRPFYGVRGYWSSLHYRIRSDLNGVSGDLSNPIIFRRDRDSLKQSSWGVGLLAGLESNFYFTTHWSFATLTDIALVYGKVSQKRRSRLLAINDLNQTELDTQFTYTHASYAMLPMLDLGLGIQWDAFLGNNNRYYLSLLAGWESHFLIDYFYLDRNFEESLLISSILAADGNLTLSGLVLRALFQF